MVVLRSSLELHSHSAAPASSSLDMSNGFLISEQIGRRRLRSARAAEQSAVSAAAAGVSTGPGRDAWAGPGGTARGPFPRWGLRVGDAAGVTVGGWGRGRLGAVLRRRS